MVKASGFWTTYYTFRFTGCQSLQEIERIMTEKSESYDYAANFVESF